MEREYIQDGAGVPGVSGSTWLAPQTAQRPSITGDITADALVVGAGIVGALVAFAHARFA